MFFLSHTSGPVLLYVSENGAVTDSTTVSTTIFLFQYSYVLEVVLFILVMSVFPKLLQLVSVTF